MAGMAAPCPVILQKIPRNPADDPANQNHQRDAILVEPDCVRESFDRKRAECVDLLVSRAMSFLGCGQEFLRRIEFGHQSVHGSLSREIDGSVAHRFTSSASRTCASGSKVLNSAIETIGRMRTNSHIAVRNRPLVPANVI